MCVYVFYFFLISVFLLLGFWFLEFWGSWIFVWVRGQQLSMNYFDWIWSHVILTLGIQISLSQDPHMPLGGTTVSDIETRVSNIGWVLWVGMRRRHSTILRVVFCRISKALAVTFLCHLTLAFKKMLLFYIWPTQCKLFFQQ